MLSFARDNFAAALTGATRTEDAASSYRAITESSYIANCFEIQVKNHYTQAMSYDRDLRLRVLEYAQAGHSLTQTAAVFKVNISTIIAWKRRSEATGDVKVKIRRPVKKKIIPEELIEYVEAHPDAYLKEIAKVFGCHLSSVLKRLRKLGITRKKRVPFTKNKTPNK